MAPELPSTLPGGGGGDDAVASTTSMCTVSCHESCGGSGGSRLELRTHAQQPQQAHDGSFAEGSRRVWLWAYQHQQSRQSKQSTTLPPPPAAPAMTARGTLPGSDGSLCKSSPKSVARGSMGDRAKGGGGMDGGGDDGGGEGGAGGGDGGNGDGGDGGVGGMGGGGDGGGGKGGSEGGGDGDGDRGGGAVGGEGGGLKAHPSSQTEALPSLQLASFQY